MPRPRQRYIRNWLTKQAGKGGELDYICNRLSDGEFLITIAAEIEKDTQVEVPQHSLRRYLIDQFGKPEVLHRFEEARKDAADVHVAEAWRILDTAPEVREALAKAKQKADYKMWLAKTGNRERWGDTPNSQVTVNLTAGALHLNALRSRTVQQLPAVALIAPVVDQLDGGDEQEQGDEAEREGEH